MTWYWWLCIGIVVGVAGFLAWLWMMNEIDYRIRRRRQAVRDQQSAAERQMQALVQSTIAELFRNARGLR